MTQPKQPRSKASPARAGAKPARKGARPRTAPATDAAPPESEDGRLSALREKLVESITLPTDRLQETLDDAVRRGRMTRKDAEELLATLVSTGRSQTEALLADLEQLLGRTRLRAAPGGDRVLQEVDRARRKVGVGGFPIMGYDELTAAEITKRLADLTPAELRKVRDHERRRGNRKSVLAAIDKKLG